MIKLRTRPDSSVLCQPLGALDFEAASELRHHIARIVRPDLELVFDLSRVDHIDAFGASVLVASVRRVRAMGGRSRVCRVNAVAVEGTSELSACHEMTWRKESAATNAFAGDTPA